MKEIVFAKENLRVLNMPYFMKFVEAFSVFTFEVCYVGNHVYCTKDGYRFVCNCNQCFVCFLQLLN